jgi:hypothetical protein
MSEGILPGNANLPMGMRKEAREFAVPRCQYRDVQPSLNFSSNLKSFIEFKKTTDPIPYCVHPTHWEACGVELRLPSSPAAFMIF